MKTYKRMKSNTKNIISEETEIIEFKRSTSELKEAVISIVAILNKHQKGKLYFGIKNDGTIVGQDVTENTLREISKAISDHIEPKIYPKINKIELDNKSCVIVEFEGSENPYFAYGRAHIRVSDEDRKLSAKELEKLILKKNRYLLRWDNEICEGASLNDIDNSTITGFVKLVKKSKRISIKNESKELILRKLGLLTDKGLTNAAILLFGNNPNQYFHNLTLKCGRFKTESTFIDIKDSNENLFQQLNTALVL